MRVAKYKPESVRFTCSRRRLPGKLFGRGSALGTQVQLRIGDQRVLRPYHVVDHRKNPSPNSLLQFAHLDFAPIRRYHTVPVVGLLGLDSRSEATLPSPNGASSVPSMIPFPPSITSVFPVVALTAASSFCFSSEVKSGWMTELEVVG
jgi:hypothetical protein